MSIPIVPQGMPGNVPLPDSTPTPTTQPSIPGQSALPGQTSLPGQPALPGQTSLPGQPAAPGQPAVPGQTTLPGQTTTTATGTTTLPLTEQPIQDQISQSGQIPQLLAGNYSASLQVPVLPKPLEPGVTPTLSKPAEAKTEKQDKKAEKEVTGGTDQQQQVDSPQVDGEPKANKEQQQDGQQSGGGGPGGGNSGSDSGGSNSGSFSGGGDQSNKERGTGSTSLEGSNQTLGTGPTTSAKMFASLDGAVAADQSPEAAYAKAIDPTGTAVMSASGLFSPPVNAAQFFDNGAKMMAELTKMNVAFTKSLPDGPDKMRFINFLLQVQDALNQFQQLLRELQMNDSKGAQERSKAQLETSLEKIETQRKQQADMAKKSGDAAAKAKIMGPLAILFAFLLVILLIVLMTLFLAVLIMSFPPLGMMVVALIVSEFLDQCATAAGKKPFAIQGLANLVMSFVDALVTSWNHTVGGTEESAKVAKAVLKTIMVALIMAISTLLAPGLILFGGVTALLSFLSASHVVKDAALAAGMKEDEAEKVEMYTGIAVGALYAVAAFAVAFVLPEGAMGGAITVVTNAIKTAAKEAAQLVFQLLSAIPRVSDKVATAVAKTVQAMVKVALDPQTWVQVTGLGLQTTNAVATYNYQSILADIALIQGRMDSEIELKDATIQMLKKMIKQLLDGLAGIADDMAAVGQLLKKTHSDVSQMTGALFG